MFVGGDVGYAYTCIPTYPSGQIGFMLCSKAGGSTDFLTPQRSPPLAGAPRLLQSSSTRSDPPLAGAGNASLQPLRYYNAQVHRAAFVLPEFARAALADSLTVRE